MFIYKGHWTLLENLNCIGPQIESKAHCSFIKKMGQSRPLFVYFCTFLVTISIQTEKSIDSVQGIQTRGRRMVGADETT